MEFALRRLGNQAMSAAELRVQLQRRAADPSDTDAVLLKLAEAGLLDDRRFAESYAGRRADTFGKMRVLRDLKQRDVDTEVAREAVDSAFEGTDERQLAERFIERKYRGIDLKNYFSEQRHIVSTYRKLRLAGFSTSVVSSLLQQYAPEVTGLEDMDTGEDA